MTVGRIIKLLEYLSTVEMDAHYRSGTQSETDKALRLLRKMEEKNAD